MGEMDGTGAFKQIGLQHYGTADIASGWLEFAIFIDAYQATDGDLRQCFALFTTIENEIAESNRRGLLKVRPIVPLPDSPSHRRRSLSRRTARDGGAKHPRTSSHRFRLGPHPSLQ